MNRALTIKTGQTHVQRYMRPLLERIERGRDRSDASSSRTACRSTRRPTRYEMFRDKQDDCIKVVLKP